MDNTHPLDFRPFPSQAGCFKCSNRSVQEQLWNCSFRRTLDPCSPWPNCSAPVRPLRSVCSRFVSSQWTVPSCENYTQQLHRLRRRKQKAHLRPLGHGSRQTGGVAFLTPLSSDLGLLQATAAKVAYPKARREPLLPVAIGFFTIAIKSLLQFVVDLVARGLRILQNFAGVFRARLLKLLRISSVVET